MRLERFENLLKVKGEFICRSVDCRECPVEYLCDQREDAPSKVEDFEEMIKEHKANPPMKHPKHAVEDLKIKYKQSERVKTVRMLFHEIVSELDKKLDMDKYPQTNVEVSFEDYPFLVVLLNDSGLHWEELPGHNPRKLVVVLPFK